MALAMTLLIDRREIVEIVRPIESGVTEPFLCIGDDDLPYCVKGREILDRGKVAETICAIAGREIGLPIPDFCIAELSGGLARLENEVPSIRKIGLSPAFASKWIEPTDVFSIVMQHKVPKEVLAKIFLFDRWIMNSDRTLTENGGNVNLLLELPGKNLIVIDHNLALSHEMSDEDARVHVGYLAWQSLAGRRNFALGVREEMLTACAKLEDVRDLLPEEWLEQAPDMLDNALEALARVSANDFWDAIP